MELPVDLIVVIKAFISALLAVYATEKSLHFDFARQLHDAVYHGFGARGATGDVDVDRDDIGNAAGHMV